jgi:pyrroline-5-carboxylate reductase
MQQTLNKIGFIGSGNMAMHLLDGLLHKHYPKSHVIASDRSAERLSHLQKKFAIVTYQDNCQLVQQADIVILAVKPNIIYSVLREIRHIVAEKKVLLISIAAGVTIQQILATLATTCAVIRCMPNIAASVACAATALCANADVTEPQRQNCATIFSAVGIVSWLTDESLLDVVTALSGSGPAYFFLLMEMLEKVALELGLPTQLSHNFTIQTALGAARMAKNSDETLSILRQQVTSPHGTTERGLRVLFDANIEQIVRDTLLAATERAREISQQLQENN